VYGAGAKEREGSRISQTRGEGVFLCRLFLPC
jgi:hypothetical protein